MERQRTEKLILFFTVVLFVISGIGLGVYYFSRGVNSPLYMGLVTPLFILIPVIFTKLKIKLPYRLLLLFYVYMILAYNVGFIMDGYKVYILFHWDKIVHLFSGFLYTTVGMCIFIYMKKSSKSNWALGILFSLFFSMFIALVCEFVEYAVYLTTSSDPQLNLTTGVVDTMEDLFVCLYGSLIVVFFYMLYFRKGLRIWKKPIIEEFSELNGLE